jgi:hypothetical protein
MRDSAAMRTEFVPTRDDARPLEVMALGVTTRSASSR